MNQQPTTDVLPSEEELAVQKENQEKWLALFKRLAAFASTTPKNTVYSIKVFVDPTQLAGLNLAGITDVYINDREDPSQSVFSVICGTTQYVDFSGDINFLFCPDHCVITTNYHGGEHELSPKIDAMVKKLLQIDEVSNIRQLKDIKDEIWTREYRKDDYPLELDGNATEDYVSLNDGLLILKHWIAITTSDMKKSDPQHNPLPA